MNNEPVAWGMLDSEGGIYDSISPAEHDREEGAYTIPLYTHPSKDLTDEEIIAISNGCLVGATAWHNPDLDPIEFARAILRKATK